MSDEIEKIKNDSVALLEKGTKFGVEFRDWFFDNTSSDWNDQLIMISAVNVEVKKIELALSAWSVASRAVASGGQS